jgi:hypothetical protein
MIKNRIVSAALFACSVSLLLSPMAEISHARSEKQNTAPALKAVTARVEFLEPTNGSVVPEVFKVRMNVVGYKIAPLGEMEKGKGHHHLVINGGPVEEGKVVPTDAQHIHFGKGQTETELTLKPGKHTLTLQFGDGAHRSYGPALSQTIEITVGAQTGSSSK